MLLQENVQQTVRLALLNAFKETDSGLTEMLLDLNRRCPTLFDSLLPKSEQESLLEKEDDENDDIVIQGDDNHKRPSAIGCLQAKYCREELGLPTRSSDLALPPWFGRLLREAYGRDYNMPNIVHFGKAAIQWCKKFSFFDRCVTSMSPTITDTTYFCFSLIIKCSS
jgi:hypothetical protein